MRRLFDTGLPERPQNDPITKNAPGTEFPSLRQTVKLCPEPNLVCRCVFPRSRLERRRSDRRY
jgi:hypothetical protein